MKKGKITIEVAGGLGNQLFCYFAGFTFANNLGVDLEVDLLFASNAHSAQFDIRSFELPGSFRATTASGRKALRLFVRKVLDSLSYRSQRLGAIRNRLHKVLLENPGSEFDPNLIHQIRVGQRVQGFFATSKYIRMLQKQNYFKTLDLASPSEWFRQISKIAQETSPICVHVRRGDFLFAKDSYGVLSEEYFRKALDMADALRPGRKVWVFSDDMQLVKSWKIFQGNRFDFIDGVKDGIHVSRTQEELDPAEFLKLMTFASVNIISNSSFSYFGAMLNPNNPVVIRPNPTAKSPKNRMITLYPDDWISCPAVWE